MAVSSSSDKAPAKKKNKIVISNPASWPAPPSTWWEGDKKGFTSDGQTLLIYVDRKFSQGPGVEEYSPRLDDLIGPEPGRDQVAATSSVAGDTCTKIAAKLGDSTKCSAERITAGKKTTEHAKEIYNLEPSWVKQFFAICLYLLNAFMQTTYIPRFPHTMSTRWIRLPGS